jgi:hypothetical protein
MEFARIVMKIVLSAMEIPQLIVYLAKFKNYS